MFSSCTTSPELPQSDINGIWNWTRSVGGWGGIVADSVEYTQSLVIDLDLRKAVLFKNDEFKTRYTVKRERAISDNRMHWFLYPKNVEPQINYKVELIAEDELLLRPSCDDCFFYHFER
ncbi:MAG: hypothetical protein U5K69_29005 [Balneolaceae bacterium]|nr:hypothetical protein [Balneolaceae bacterium]